MPSVTELTIERLPPGTSSQRVPLRGGGCLQAYSLGEGPPLLFLHGFPELAVSYKEQFHDLARDHRVIAVDMRGYGESYSPHDVAAYHRDRLVEDVIDVLNAFSIDRVHLIGHDWGGALAWEVAAQQPHRLASLSVLNCPPASLMLRSIANPRQVAMSWYIFFFQLPLLPEFLIARDPESFVRSVFESAALRRESFDEFVRAPYVEQIRSHGLCGLNYYRAAMRAPATALTPLRVPTQLIWGMRDHALGPWFADGARYRSWVKGPFSIVRIPDAAHWVQQEAPAEVNAAIRSHVHKFSAQAHGP